MQRGTIGLLLLTAAASCQESTTASAKLEDQKVEESAPEKTVAVAEKKEGVEPTAEGSEDTNKNKRGLHLGYGYGEGASSYYHSKSQKIRPVKKS